MKRERGFIFESPSRAPDQDREHFRSTQGRPPSARIAREVLGLEVRLERFEIFVYGDRELEQRVETAYLLLDEPRSLQGLSGFRTTLIPLRADALQPLPGIALLEIITDKLQTLFVTDTQHIESCHSGDPHREALYHAIAQFQCFS